MIPRLISCLIVCLVMMSAAGAETITAHGDGLYQGETFVETVPMNTGQTLTVNAAGSLSGMLTITAGGNVCRVTYIKHMKASAKSEATEFAELIGVDIDTQSNDAVVLSLRAPARTPWSGTANSAVLEIEVQIPDGTPVEITTSYFDIDATGPFAGFTVSESLSQVTIEDVRGPVDVKVSNRPLLIKNVTGPLTASNKYGRIKLEQIQTGDHLGSVLNENGEILIDDFVGAIDARTSYGEIIGQHLTLTGTRNRFRNVSAPINIAFDSLTSGRIRVNNHYGQITLECAGALDAAFICKFGEESRVLADGMNMEPTLIFDDRLEFTVAEATAEVRLTVKGDGNIVITGPEAPKTSGGR